MDTNPCDEDHWFYRDLRGGAGHRAGAIFHQPSGLESRTPRTSRTCPTTTTPDCSTATTRSGSTSTVHGRYGFVMDGKPVHPTYQDDVHASDEVIPFEPSDAVSPSASTSASRQQRRSCSRTSSVSGAPSTSLITEDTATDEFAEHAQWQAADVSTVSPPRHGPSGATQPATPASRDRCKTTPYDGAASPRASTQLPVWTNDEIDATWCALDGSWARLAMNGQPGFHRVTEGTHAAQGTGRRLQVPAHGRSLAKSATTTSPRRTSTATSSKRASTRFVGAGEGDKLIESSVGRNRKPRVIRAGGMRYPRPAPHH